MSIRAIIFILFFFILFLIHPAQAITLTINPENPATGDEITIRGTASPNEVLNPTVTFDKIINAANGKYDYRLSGIKIPSGENKFAATAMNVKNLNVRIKMLLWWTKSTDASNGTARVSQGNVPSGTYNVRIDGDAADGSSSVPLTITASSKITADPKGDFEFRYSSSGIPAGAFNLSIAGTTKTIILSETPAPVITPGITQTYLATPTSSVSRPVGIPGFEIVFAVFALMVWRCKKI